jgi:hypothetical protein
MRSQPLDVTSIVFFCSFIILANVVLVNIVIAVLLDEFLSTLSKARSSMDMVCACLVSSWCQLTSATAICFGV